MTLAMRRLALSIRRVTQARARTVTLICAARAGSGTTETARDVAAALAADGVTFRVVDGSELAAPPAADAPVLLVDLGGVLVGRGPVIDKAWLPRIAGAVVIVQSGVDTVAELDAVRGLLEVLEIPVLGFAWSARAEPPARARLGAFVTWLRVRAVGVVRAVRSRPVTDLAVQDVRDAVHGLAR